MAGPAEQTAPREDLREGWKLGRWRRSLWDLCLQRGQSLPKALPCLQSSEGTPLAPTGCLLVWPQPGGDTQGKFRFHPAFTQPKRPPGRAPVSSSSLAPMKLKLGDHTGVQTHMLGCLA